MTDVFERYAEITKEINLLESEREACQRRILEELTEAGAEKVISPYGTFMRTIRRSWRYSPKLEAMKIVYDEKLKNERELEERNGTATCATSYHLRFLKPKE